jgi:hypothetical protein
MVMKGVEGVRPAAVYQANRVLFLPAVLCCVLSLGWAERSPKPW